MKWYYWLIPFKMVPDYIQGILRQKDCEIIDLMEHNKKIKEELQMLRSKYTKIDRINLELQLKLLSLAGNNNDLSFNPSNSITTHGEDGDNAPTTANIPNFNCRDSRSRNNYQNNVRNSVMTSREKRSFSSSTPLRKRNDEPLMNLVITPILKNSESGESPDKCLMKLESTLKKYEINISASLRILHNLMERKNPSPCDLFSSFFDVNSEKDSDDEYSEEVVVSNEEKIYGDLSNTTRKFSSMPFLVSDENGVNNKLVDLCNKAHEILLQWDMFHQQLLICIGSGVLDCPMYSKPAEKNAKCAGKERIRRKIE